MGVVFTAEQHAAAVSAGVPFTKSGLGQGPGRGDAARDAHWHEYQDDWLSAFDRGATLPPPGNGEAGPRWTEWKRLIRQHGAITAAAARLARRTVTVRPASTAAESERSCLATGLHVSHAWVRANLGAIVQLRVGELALSACAQGATRELSADVRAADGVVSVEAGEVRYGFAPEAGESDLDFRRRRMRHRERELRVLEQLACPSKKRKLRPDDDAEAGGGAAAAAVAPERRNGTAFVDAQGRPFVGTPIPPPALAGRRRGSAGGWPYVIANVLTTNLLTYYEVTTLLIA